MKKSPNLKKKIVFSLLAIILLGAGAIAWLAMSMLRPMASQPAQTIRFVVPKGQAVSIIGQRLYEEKLIRHPLVFRFVVEAEGLGNTIQSGSFDVSPSMTPAEIARKLTTGTEDVWVTLLEGWRVEEIAENLNSRELESFDSDAFIALAQTSEGKLYPDTYLIPRQMTAEQVYSLLISTFEKKVLQGLSSEIAASDKDFDDVLIMASIVEREAREYEQMRHVAGILWHRIAIGMPLQVDATLQYVVGYNKQTQSWWSPPLAIYKELDSPFNTYQNLGLPPRPIANPSLQAIRATLDYLATTDLFYIHAPDGSMHYAKDLAGHTANVNRYLR